MNIKKLLFGGIIASAMSLGLMAAIGLNKSDALGVDAAPTADKVFIGDVSFDANPYYKNGDTTTFTGTSLDYNAYYDVSTGELELNGYIGDKISCTSTERITINLTSHNEIDTTGGSDDLYGVYAKGGVTFTGDGDLDITLAKDDGHNSGIGIYSPENINVHGSVELNIDVRGVTKAHQSGMRTDEGIYLGYSSALSIYATAHVDQLYAVYGIEMTAGSISFASSGDTYIELNVEEGNESFNNAAIYLQGSDHTVSNNGSMSVGSGGDITLAMNGGGFGIGILSDFDSDDNLEGEISFSSGATTIIDGFNYGIWNISEERATPSADILLSNNADVQIHSNKEYGKGLVSEQNGILVDNAHLSIDVNDRPIDVHGGNGGLYIDNESTFGFDVTGSSQVDIQSLSGINTYSDATCDFDLTGSGYFRFSIGGTDFPSLAGTFKAKLHPGTRFTNELHYSWDDDTIASDGGRKIIHSYGYDDEILEIVAFDLPTSANVQVNAFTLSGSENYYVNDAVEATSDPTGYNAYYDKDNAVLYLKGYEGGNISFYGEGDGIFRIYVENDSIISSEIGIDVRGYASLEIYGKAWSYLNINAENASGDAAAIAVANGDLSFHGTLNLRITSRVTSSDDGVARGLSVGYQYSGGQVAFYDSIDASIVTRSAHEVGMQNAVYARSTIEFNAKTTNSHFIFDTSGVVGGSYSIYAGSNIYFNSYNDIQFKWSEKDGNYSQGPTYPTNKIQTVDNGVYNINEETFIATLNYGNGGHVEVINGHCTNAASGNYTLGSIAYIQADAISGLTFTGWNHVSGTGEFVDDTQSSASGELRVGSDETVEATYNFVEMSPFFDSRKEYNPGNGIIKYKFRGTPSLVQIVESADHSNIVYSSNYPSGTSITSGDVPAGSYCLCATYGTHKFYTASFVVDYSADGHDYVLTFKAGDGSGSDYVVNNKYGGYSLPEFATTGLTAPEGYKFVSWGGYAPGVAWLVDNDYTFTAVYELIPEYTMEFVGGAGYVSGAMDLQVKKEGENFVLPVPTFTCEDHMTFAYWNVGGAEKHPGDTIPATGNMTAEAVYEYLAQYTLTFDHGDGTGSMAEVVKYSDENFVLPQSTFTAPENFEFSHWEVSGVEKHPGDTIPATADIEAVAKYTRIQVTISFDAGEGTGTMADVPHGKGTNYVLPASTFTAPAHKQFKCWSIGGEEYQVGADYLVTSNVTITAVYEDIVRNIAFSAGDGTGTMTGTTIVDGQSYVLPASTFTAPAHKEFKCWSIGGEEYQVGDPYVVNSDITIVAVFQDIAVNISVEVEGGSGSQIISGTDGGQVVLPECTLTAPEGKQFDGWIVDGVKHEAGESVTINVGSTIKAAWKDIPVEPETPTNPDTPATPDTPTTPTTPENPPKKGLSGGAIAGIVIASVVVVGVGGFALTWFVILKKTFADFLAIFKKK